jgi:hypothetical protein
MLKIFENEAIHKKKQWQVYKHICIEVTAVIVSDTPNTLERSGSVASAQVC